jgi:ferrochelatase
MTEKQTKPQPYGLLLANLGTPQSPERKPVARFLLEFLSDPRVVDLPRYLWLPLLRLVIVPLRARRSAAAYRKIWRPDGSPLLVFTERLADKMDAALLQAPVAVGMRYGEPSIRAALGQLQAKGVERLAILPLYPQFSHTTTSTIFDAVDRALERIAWRPEQIRIADYHDYEPWIRAVASSVRDFQARNGRPDKLVFSMHGIPQRYVAQGDPYEQQCRDSVAAVVSELGLRKEDWVLTFQSRVGREPWLQPYTDQTLEQLGAAGLRHVQVLCPGFAVDCLETLEEIAIENRGIFEQAGGGKLEYIPALNDSDAHVEALTALIKGSL